MRRSLTLLASAVIILATLAGGGQVPKKPDIVGTWVGYGNAPNMRFDLTAVFDKNETGYVGKLSDSSGMLAETPLRQIVFQEGKLTFEFDLVMGVDAMVIKIELTLENDVLKGSWSNAEGNSDIVELTLKK